MRIKSRWFKGATRKTPQQCASVMALIVWRVAQNMLQQMRSAQFDIEVGPQYFAFTREVLVFLTQVLDRMAYEHMNVADRAAFMSALVTHLAAVLQDNEDTLLGQPLPGQATHGDEFIDLFNELADHYSEFGFGPDGPDFAFVRYLGHRIEAMMPRKDRLWVVDQIMACEVPAALSTLQKGMQGILVTESALAQVP